MPLMMTAALLPMLTHDDDHDKDEAADDDHHHDAYIVLFLFCSFAQNPRIPRCVATPLLFFVI